MIVGLRASPPLGGTTISDGVIASAQGLFEGSSVALLVLLSFLLSRILLGSPLTARDLAKPEELDPELDESATVLEPILATLEVSMRRFGDLPPPAISSSTQPAGVGGTGPNLEIGGLRVGGDIIRSVGGVML